MAYPQLVLFGDSLTQHSTDQTSGFGLTAALQNDYVRRLDVINRGYSGYNSAQALAMLPKMVEPYKEGGSRIVLMTIFFGANDACLPNSTTNQQVPLPTFRANLKSIIHSPLLATHAPRFILITPPPIDEYGRARSALLKSETEIQRTAEHTKLYADACREVGEEESVVTLDLWSVIMRKAGWKEGQPLIGSKEMDESEVLGRLLHDGLHFTAEAYRILYEELMGVIEKRVPEVRPEAMPFVFPIWEEAPKRVSDMDHRA